MSRPDSALVGRLREKAPVDFASPSPRAIRTAYVEDFRSAAHDAVRLDRRNICRHAAITRWCPQLSRAELVDTLPTSGLSKVNRSRP